MKSVDSCGYALGSSISIAIFGVGTMSNFDDSYRTGRTYEDGVEDGERKGRQEGFTSGLQTGRSECQLENQQNEAEKARQAATEAHRVFWDTAFPQDPKMKAEEQQFNAKAEAAKADTNVKGFIADVQTMSQNEFLSTEKELDTIYAQKLAAYKEHHGWFQPKPASPMSVHRGDSGTVASIEFPKQGYTIPVTYWNSQVEANRIQDLSVQVQNAPSAMDRSIALKALTDELNTLKLPQIAALEVKKTQH